MRMAENPKQKPPPPSDPSVTVNKLLQQVDRLTVKENGSRLARDTSKPTTRGSSSTRMSGRPEATNGSEKRAEKRDSHELSSNQRLAETDAAQSSGAAGLLPSAFSPREDPEQQSPGSRYSPILSIGMRMTADPKHTPSTSGRRPNSTIKTKQELRAMTSESKSESSNAPAPTADPIAKQVEEESRATRLPGLSESPPPSATKPLDPESTSIDNPDQGSKISINQPQADNPGKIPYRKVEEALSQTPINHPGNVQTDPTSQPKPESKANGNPSRKDSDHLQSQEDLDHEVKMATSALLQSQSAEMFPKLIEKSTVPESASQKASEQIETFQQASSQDSGLQSREILTDRSDGGMASQEPIISGAQDSLEFSEKSGQNVEETNLPVPHSKSASSSLEQAFRDIAARLGYRTQALSLDKQAASHSTELSEWHSTIELDNMGSLTFKFTPF